MDNLLINLLNGLSFAMILFLISSGFSLIFGVMGVLNLAHGAFYILGVYFALTMVNYGATFILAAFAGGIGVALVGLVLERVFLNRLHGKISQQVLLTFGFVYIFVNLAIWAWGPFARLGTPPSILSGSLRIGEAFFPFYRFAVILIGLALAASLWFLTERTRVGAMVRAGMDNKETAMALGVNYKFVSSGVFFIGSFVAGLAGFIGAPVVATNPGMAFDLSLLALVVTIVGGVGQVQCALVGSILIGLIDSFGRAYFPDFAYFIIYLVMIVALLVKPSGILGKVR